MIACDADSGQEMRKIKNDWAKTKYEQLHLQFATNFGFLFFVYLITSPSFYLRGLVRPNNSHILEYRSQYVDLCRKKVVWACVRDESLFELSTTVRFLFLERSPHSHYSADRVSPSYWWTCTRCGCCCCCIFVRN